MQLSNLKVFYLCINLTEMKETRLNTAKLFFNCNHTAEKIVCLHSFSTLIFGISGFFF